MERAKLGIWAAWAVIWAGSVVLGVKLTQPQKVPSAPTLELACPGPQPKTGFILALTPMGQPLLVQPAREIRQTPGLTTFLTNEGQEFSWSGETLVSDKPFQVDPPPLVRNYALRQRPEAALKETR